MSINNPTTYAEWYWAQQVDASKAFADAEEESLLPFVQHLLALVEPIRDISPALFAGLEAFATPGHFGLAAVGQSVASGASSMGISSAIDPVLRMIGYQANKHYKGTRIGTNEAITLANRKRLTPESFLDATSAYGFNENQSDLLLYANQPYPDMYSLFSWARYITDGVNTKEKLEGYIFVDPADYELWDWLTQIRLSPNEVQALYVRQYMTGEQAQTELLRNGYKGLDIAAIMDLSYAIPNANIILQHSLLEGLPYDAIQNELTVAGIHPDYTNSYINAVLAKPDPAEMIRYLLRTDPYLDTLESELTKLGVHPKYLHVFKTLAYPVPPVGDMITMAVREAFSPEIAERFGQYEDYPQDLTHYAGMNGISEEWAKRYWAAHWSLPSPQQGMEMLHRGVITHDELNLLLRALDIMPFWRDKLIQISYRPLTRVDVRRMYSLGVLSEDEVIRAYRDAGYSEENARRMKDFVVRQTMTAQSGLSVGKVITAYKNGYTTRSESFTVLNNLGIRAASVSDILEAADKQLEWQRTKDAIAAIGNQYKQELSNVTQTRMALAGLRLDAVKIDNLMDRWEKDGIKAQKTLWTKADTLTMLKKQIIGYDRALQELKLLGYNTERANALLTLTAGDGK